MQTKAVAKNVYHLGTFGKPPIVSCYLAVGSKIMLLEPGPSGIVDELAEAVNSLGINVREIDYVFTSHVHLDHAGGAWKVLELAPKAKVLVSQNGARHMVDPSRLVESARGVLGESMKEWGEMKPVNPDRLVPVSGGERIDLGGPSIRIIATLGHAPHHVSAFEERSGSVVTGDAVGVYYRDISALVPASAPPSFDLEKAIESLHAISGLKPRLLLMPHYGITDKALEHLQANVEMYRLWEKEINHVLSVNGGEQEARDRLVELIPPYVKLSKKKYGFANFAIDIRGFIKYLSAGQNAKC